jgi:hypothetical protein
MGELAVRMGNRGAVAALQDLQIQRPPEVVVGGGFTRRELRGAFAVGNRVLEFLDRGMRDND